MYMYIECLFILLQTYANKIIKTGWGVKGRPLRKQEFKKKNFSTSIKHEKMRLPLQTKNQKNENKKNETKKSYMDFFLGY